ncbi:Glycine/D-amino acid oxidase [Chryseobacterium taichungense]|uniref:Glycine/D-amino acid oxidase n=2 Tax=Chryseobacterium taichungense TaxID=295069 RepID=A0A1H8AC43_9FLAO|nr:Glycine/D-amino acid oxidase [Chryseobacterium taichungense]
MICGITKISLDNYRKPEYFYSGFFIMKNVDYIIVGDGYAALFFAHQLIKNNKSFVLFSEQKKSASQISAGIINPVVLKKFTTFWKAQEQIDFLKRTLNEIESYTGQNYLINAPIHRIFHDEKEKELWLKKSENDELKFFLDKNFDHLKVVKNDFYTGKVNQSARLDVNGFFVGLFGFLENQGCIIKEKFKYSDLNSSLNTYKDFSYKNILFCEGMGVRQNPFFLDIPVNANKGHHIKVNLSQPIPQNITIKKKHFLFPLNEKIYFYGGTYDRDHLHHGIDDSAVEQLKKGLSEFYPYDFSIIEANFGLRPTVKDRRPIIGKHSKFQNMYVFNGLGARGILNGCYFSKSLFDHIEKNIPLPEEVSLERFASK